MVHLSRAENIYFKLLYFKIFKVENNKNKNEKIIYYNYLVDKIKMIKLKTLTMVKINDCKFTMVGTYHGIHYLETQEIVAKAPLGSRIEP